MQVDTLVIDKKKQSAHEIWPSSRAPLPFFVVDNKLTLWYYWLFKSTQNAPVTGRGYILRNTWPSNELGGRQKSDVSLLSKKKKKNCVFSFYKKNCILKTFDSRNLIEHCVSCWSEINKRERERNLNNNNNKNKNGWRIDLGCVCVCVCSVLCCVLNRSRDVTKLAS